MVQNLSCYAFFDLKDSPSAKLRIEDLLLGTATVGTILIAREGVNLNLASSMDGFEALITEWLASLGATDFSFKRSQSSTRPFKRLRVRVKKEIITMGVPHLNVEKWHAPHISPEDFAALLKNPLGTLILDTRNDFEVGVGTFQGATPAGMRSFTEFPRVAANLPRDRKIVMFCTGGIRCEKASAYLKQQGFEDVLQLEGGILGYFDKQGRKGFDGSCFVFDERMSLDATTYVSENRLQG